jgi:hypothetical protein
MLVSQFRYFLAIEMVIVGERSRVIYIYINHLGVSVSHSFGQEEEVTYRVVGRGKKANFLRVC